MASDSQLAPTSNDSLLPLSPLLLKDAPLLLMHPYLPLESGYALTSDGMYHIAAHTYMPQCTGAMISWFFGWMHHTWQYKLWHPRDHVFSDWEGPRENDSSYVGCHHLVHEYIGGRLAKLKISFCDPSVYFGDEWQRAFAEAGYSTAICARVGNWNPEDGNVVYTGHLIHLIKDEPDGCRMRSRFWLGDVEGVTEAEERARLVPLWLVEGLCRHATEEMGILAEVLPGLYEKYRK